MTNKIDKVLIGFSEKNIKLSFLLSNCTVG